MPHCSSNSLSDDVIMSSENILENPLFSLNGLKKSSEFVWNSDLCHKTPLMVDAHYAIRSSLPKYIHNLSFKMECAQNGGSFKTRGVVCQLQHLKDFPPKKELSMVAWSAGNYGKCFAMVAEKMGLSAYVIMSTSVPSSRTDIIRSFKAEVELVDSCHLLPTLQKRVDEGRIRTHPFDDPHLISGYGSVGFELMDTLKGCEPDVILVPVGGGGLISGIAAALRQMGWTKTKIYGVEPCTSNVMYLCLKEDKLVELPTAKSVAVGTCSPEGGKYTFPLCRKYVDGILLVSDEEIIRAMNLLFRSLQLAVEPTGAVGLAAVISGKLDGLAKENTKLNVVVLLTGSNISLVDFCRYMA